MVDSTTPARVDDAPRSAHICALGLANGPAFASPCVLDLLDLARPRAHAARGINHLVEELLDRLRGLLRRLPQHVVAVRHRSYDELRSERVAVPAILRAPVDERGDSAHHKSGHLRDRRRGPGHLAPYDHRGRGEVAEAIEA